MKIGILIPSTSAGRSWKSYKESYLYELTLKTFLLTYDQDHEYHFYIGIDAGDPIYDNPAEIAQFQRFVGIMKHVAISFHSMEGIAKGHLTKMWNRIFQIAYDDGCDYFFQCGDDIAFRTKGWVGACIATLQQTGGIGMTGPLNNNARILTQSFVGRKHMELFGYYFPEEIKNWFCDDWINIVYRKLGHFYPLHGFQCDNLGGNPRYHINDDPNYMANVQVNHPRLQQECARIADRDFQRASEIMKRSPDQNVSVVPAKYYICGCVKNCAKHIDAIFANIDILAQFLGKDAVQIIVAYDDSTDNSLELLNRHLQRYPGQMKVLQNPAYEAGWRGPTHIRTRNIANARNAILREIGGRPNADDATMIAMDFDEVCTTPMNLDVLREAIDRPDWDAISFHRDRYYDIWALSAEPYVFSCWHWNEPVKVVDIMKRWIVEKLDGMSKGDLLPCLSAFNGFAMYRLAKFRDCVYDWQLMSTLPMIGKDRLAENQKMLSGISVQFNNFYGADCEHRHFHLQAREKHGARIRISPQCLFLYTPANEHA